MAQLSCVAIGGVPATGKSTLMRRIIELAKEQTSLTTWKYGLLNGYMFADVLIIGTYPENETFGGTDRLSMASPKHMEKFIEWACTNKHII